MKNELTKYEKDLLKDDILWRYDGIEHWDMRVIENDRIEQKNSKNYRYMDFDWKDFTQAELKQILNLICKVGIYNFKRKDLKLKKKLMKLIKEEVVK